MDCIKHLLLPHVKNIEGTENENATLAFKMYDILYEFLTNVVHTNFGGPNSKLALIGGIMINCDGDRTDKFLPLKFEVRTKTEVTDFTTECFPEYSACHEET